METNLLDSFSLFNRVCGNIYSFLGTKVSIQPQNICLQCVRYTMPMNIAEVAMQGDGGWGKSWSRRARVASCSLTPVLVQKRKSQRVPSGRHRHPRPFLYAFTLELGPWKILSGLCFMPVSFADSTKFHLKKLTIFRILETMAGQ